MANTENEAGGTQVMMVLKERKEAYGLKFILPEKYPAHKIPLGLMLKDLFTPRCGVGLASPEYVRNHPP